MAADSENWAKSERWTLEGWRGATGDLWTVGIFNLALMKRKNVEGEVSRRGGRAIAEARGGTNSVFEGLN